MANRKDCTATTARTPGPWQMRATLSGVQITSGGTIVARTPCFDRQAQADGVLLAAAPDLLGALESIVACGDEGIPQAPSLLNDTERLLAVLSIARMAIAAVKTS